MDTNHIALWFAGFIAGTLFWRSIVARRRSVAWLVVSGLVLAGGALGWLFFRNGAGYFAAALLLLGVLAPNWANNAATRASERQAYGRAHFLARVAGLLHPADGWPQKSKLFLAFQLAQEGRVADAEALLDLLGRRGGSLGVVAHAQRLRILGRFRELVAYAEHRGLLTLHTEPALLMLYLRALGEMGRVAELASFMRNHEGALTGTGADELGSLFLFAFSGQVELTERVLAAKGRAYGQEMHDFWRAVAAEHAGDHRSARAVFKRLGESRDAQVRARANDRYDHLAHAAPEEPPSAATLAVVQHFAAGITSRGRLQLNAPFRAPLVYALIAMNTLVFIAGLFMSGPDSPAFDYDANAAQSDALALFVPDLVRGQWWRALSYLFVHAGLLHLVMNMGALWALGPFVERAFGRRRFLVIYFVSGSFGTLANVFIWALHRTSDAELGHLVGASGCIMGLLGATAGLMLRAWRSERAPAARQTLISLVLVVLVQVVFDATTPRISGLAHAMGLLGGFVCGLLLRDRVVVKRQAAAHAR